MNVNKLAAVFFPVVGIQTFYCRSSPPDVQTKFPLTLNGGLNATQDHCDWWRDIQTCQILPLTAESAFLLPDHQR